MMCMPCALLWPLCVHLDFVRIMTQVHTCAQMGGCDEVRPVGVVASLCFWIGNAGYLQKLTITHTYERQKLVAMDPKSHASLLYNFPGGAGVGNECTCVGERGGVQMSVLTQCQRGEQGDGSDQVTELELQAESRNQLMCRCACQFEGLVNAGASVAHPELVALVDA